MTATSTQTLPLIALGGVYSFTVAVTGATTSMAAVINFPATLLDSLASYSANIESAGVVTVRLKAGIAIAAGSKMFVIKVIQ